MSIISLIIAPLLKGKGSWEMWYFGLIPIGLMLLGTYCVYHFFWRKVADINADLGGVKIAEDEEEGPKTEGYEVFADDGLKD
jgi:hypothetical protein